MLISICICTGGRAHLRETLLSVCNQELPPGADAEVLVVDNAPGGPARGIVDAIAPGALHPVRYSAEPRRGLSNARNRSLEAAKGDWLALIDDDEVADPDWLVKLFETASEFKADVVIGRVHAKYEENPPGFVVSSRMFERWLPATGSPLKMGNAHTANAFLRRDFVQEHGLRFEEAFNTTGGEDSDFYRRLLDLGGRIVSCREAVARELIPRDRMTELYLTHRAIRTGETYARIMQRHGGIAAAAALAVRASANVLASAVLMAGFWLARRKDYYRYYMLLLRNLGKLRYLSGARPIEMYAR